MALILSLFPGIGLLDKGFEEAGDCVVRGPDPMWGGLIEDFHPSPGVFAGVIGGPPCQDFSKARRTPPTGAGVRMLSEFVRCVEAVRPEWFLVENVPLVPDVTVRGYQIQRFNLDAKRLGFPQRRLRCFQFGSLDGKPVFFGRCDSPKCQAERTCMATEGTKMGRRPFQRFCELQGLPSTFDLPHFSIKLKYRLVGNGVHVGVARAIAIAIQHRCVTPFLRPCVCECGFAAAPNGVHATPACRKRMERKRRDASSVSGPGRDTAA